MVAVGHLHSSTMPHVMNAGIDRWAGALCAWRSLTRSADAGSGMHHHVFMLAVSAALLVCSMSNCTCGQCIASAYGMTIPITISCHSALLLYTQALLKLL